MKEHWKVIRLAVLLGALASGVSGCGGLMAERAVSPLTFLLPGLMDNRNIPTSLPPPTAPASDTNQVQIFARAR